MKIAPLLFSFLLLMACKSGVKSIDDIDDSKREMSIKKNPCYGKCPSYVLTIYQGGFATFDGKQFVEKYGLYSKKLSKKTYQGLKEAFKNANFFELEDNYPSMIADIPKVRVSYFKEGEAKTVVGDINRPKVVKDLQRMLEQVADSEGWTLVKVPELDLPDDVIPNELIIRFQPNMDVKAWVGRMDRYSLELVKELKPNSDTWLLRYDLSSIQPSQMLNLLGRTDEVLLYEFNKKTN